MWGYICPSVRIPLFSIPQISGRDSECLTECLNEIEIFFFFFFLPCGWFIIFLFNQPLHCNNEIHSHLKVLQNMFVWHCYCIVGIRDKSDFIYLFFPYSIPVLWRTFGLNFQLQLMIFCSNHQMFLLYMAVQIGCCSAFFIAQFNRCLFSYLWVATDGYNKFLDLDI